MCKTMIRQRIEDPHQCHDRYCSTKHINEGQRMATLGKQYPGRHVTYAELEDLWACVVKCRYRIVDVGRPINQPKPGQDDKKVRRDESVGPRGNFLYPSG